MKIEKYKGRKVEFVTLNKYRVETATGKIDRVQRFGKICKVRIRVEDRYDLLPDIIVVDPESIFAYFNENLNQWKEI